LSDVSSGCVVGGSYEKQAVGWKGRRVARNRGEAKFHNGEKEADARRRLARLIEAEV
jgi:hypothetical protein